MSDGINSYADLIILALIAAFILLRLRSVLGQNQEKASIVFARSALLRPLRQSPLYS